MARISHRAWVILGYAVVVLVAAGAILLVATSGNEITLKVTQPFVAGGALSAQPRVQVQIIDGDGEFETGTPLQLEYRWKACASCDKSANGVWVDGGSAMSEANVTAAKTFQADHCYKVSNIRESSEPYVIGNPVVLFDSEKEGVTEVPCP